MSSQKGVMSNEDQAYTGHPQFLFQKNPWRLTADAANTSLSFFPLPNIRGALPMPPALADSLEKGDSLFLYLKTPKL